MFVPLCLGCYKSVDKASNVEGLPNPPLRAYCPVCDDIIQTEYCRTYPRFSFCWLFSFPIGRSSPYIACTRCKFPLEGEISECSRCNVFSSKNMEFCSNCGSQKRAPSHK